MESPSNNLGALAFYGLHDMAPGSAEPGATLLSPQRLDQFLQARRRYDGGTA